MAGESIGCASRKKSKNKNSDKHENNGDQSVQQSQTTRAGLRVYKIVILGDGGVGKSGKSYSQMFEFVYIILKFVGR